MVIAVPIVKRSPAVTGDGRDANRQHRMPTISTKESPDGQRVPIQKAKAPIMPPKARSAA